MRWSHVSHQAPDLTGDDGKVVAVCQTREIGSGGLPTPASFQLGGSPGAQVLDLLSRRPPGG